MPFDRFTVEQLAGDLLPGASVAQKIASGFHRNHMINFEGGATAEERITFAFRLATARRPSASEVAVLRRVFDD